MQLMPLIVLFILPIVGIIYFFKVIPSGKFTTYIDALMVFTVLHCIAIHYDLGSPVGLLYGPLLYGAVIVQNSKPGKREVSLHLLPFIFFTSVYAVVYYSGESSVSGFVQMYYPICFSYLFVSLILYTFSIHRYYKRAKSIHTEEYILIIQLLVINLSSAFLFFLLMLKMLKPVIDYGFDLQLLIYGLLLISILLNLHYRYFKTNLRIDESSPVQRYQRSGIDGDAMNDYARQIHQYLLTTKLYLNADLSLEMLAAKTNIPKHHFSQLFNVHLGKNFYQFLAEYRVAHAKELLKKETNLKMESLAYECGFNSKTSFNKYFKETTGLTPSEYRNSMNCD